MGSVLKRSDPKRRSRLVVTIGVSNAGSLIGQFLAQTEVTNASLLLETQMDNQGYRSQGMLFGYTFYALNISNVYFEGVANHSYACLMYQPSAPQNWTMAIKVTFKGGYSAIIWRYNTYQSFFELALGIELNGPNSAAMIYRKSTGEYTVPVIYGIVLKNANNCFNGIAESAKDDFPNMTVSNTATCPAW